MAQLRERHEIMILFEADGKDPLRAIDWRVGNTKMPPIACGDRPRGEMKRE